MPMLILIRKDFYLKITTLAQEKRYSMKEEFSIDNFQEQENISPPYIENFKYISKTFTNYYEYLEVKKCYFKKCDFQDATFQGIDIDDSIFENCNLSNQELIERSYNRTIFKSCNLIGINFCDSCLDNITFENCNLTYSNFSSTKIKKHL